MFTKPFWVAPEDPNNDEYKDFIRVKQRYLAKDKYGKQVFLADSPFSYEMTKSKYPTVKLYEKSEF